MAKENEEPVLILPDVEAEPIFVVDDDENLLQTVERFLGMAGYAARAFNDPAEALAEIEQNSPKVLVTDHDMPQMTGLELALPSVWQSCRTAAKGWKSSSR